MKAEDKLKQIIVDAWEGAVKEAEESGDIEETFYLWISSITCYGFEKEEILAFANSHGINYVSDDKDPDAEEDDELGSLELTQTVIDNLLCANKDIEELKHYKVVVGIAGFKEFDIAAESDEEAKEAAARYFNMLSYTDIIKCITPQVISSEEVE